MVGSIEKSIVNTSTISVENYKTTSTIFKKYIQKIIASRPIQFFLKIGKYTTACTAMMKSTLDSKRQETLPHTVKDISDLINRERYQDAEKKIKEMLNNGYNISDRDEGNNNLPHLIAVLPKGKKLTLTELVINKTSKKEDLKLAINTKNHRGHTPLQEALSRKIQKSKHKPINFRSDNTMKLFVLLLNNGAEVDDFRLLDSKLCYKLLKELKNSESLEYNKKDQVRCLQKELKLKYDKGILKPLGTLVESILPKPITVLCLLIVLMSTYAFFQGIIGIQLALPIIIVSSITMSAPTIVQGIGDDLCSFFTNISLSKAKGIYK